jgi:hypothetical protein
MDVAIQRAHPEDLLMCQLRNGVGDVQLARKWMPRRVLWHHLAQHDIEVLQTAAYGTLDWEVARETTLS